MPPDPRIGEVLQGRYRILQRVAEGGMGVVYRGERIGLDRPVAIKFLHDIATSDADSRRRFETEAKAASRMNHPNCVAVIDFGVEREAPYLVMDFIEGHTLREIIEAGPLETPRAVALARQMLAGLAHAHGHGIIHRDLKPENVLIFRDALGEHARITDFGLAKLTDASTVTDNIAIGTPSYMSPEQTLGHRSDARSDVYGIGVMLFELFTGKKPFKGASPFDTMKLHRDAPIPAFAEVAPERKIPPAIETVIRRALAKSPDDRYPSAIELASALDNAASKAPRSKVEDTSALVARVTERPKWILPAIALGALAAAALVVAIASRGGEPPIATIDAGVAVVPVDAAPSIVAPEELPEVAAALALAREGKRGAAVDMLEALRAKHPKNAHVSYVLGNINVDRAWWLPAVQDYADALRKHEDYKRDPRLVRDLVQALASDKAYEQASVLVVEKLGAEALAELAAAERSGDRQLRSRAGRIRARIERDQRNRQ